MYLFLALFLISRITCRYYPSETWVVLFDLDVLSKRFWVKCAFSFLSVDKNLLEWIDFSFRFFSAALTFTYSVNVKFEKIPDCVNKILFSLFPIKNFSICFLSELYLHQLFFVFFVGRHFLLLQRFFLNFVSCCSVFHFVFNPVFPHTFFLFLS